ncbi:hypothetical protein C8R45DRAFT_837134 [Mycena sanguinolenta]|nr:hypothetical protein C8R45DRAFT_837134 [Mycena sanguinolenta]
MDEEALQVLPQLPTATASRAASHRRVFASWQWLLPLLEDPFAGYYRSTHAQQRTAIPLHIEHECLKGCRRKAQVVRCLYPLPSSNRPRIGVSLDVLDIYRAMFERSCDAITALAAALRTVYDRRGFTVVSDRNPLDRVADPFRMSLTHAVQWSSNLRDRIDRKLHNVLGACERALLPEETGDQLAGPSAGPSAAPLQPSAAPLQPSTAPSAEPSTPERCPACFGHTEWGRPLDQGGDVQLGADGCFSYRHLRSAGDGPIGYTPCFFIPQGDIDAVATKITQVRGNPCPNVRPPIPQDAIDGCEATFQAANEKAQRGDPKRYDASGVFLMTCRHGQILFFCNIYTPGEQQRYIIASLEELACQLPSQATIFQAYDIGCVIDHSLDLYPILADSLRNRVTFIINHMHSYRHEWACQVTFGPRFRLGAGIADHEDVERVWSRTRKTVPITRGQWNSRRIWMLDQYGVFLNAEGLENLGTWIERQDKNLRTKIQAALKTFGACRVSEAEVRRQWRDQKEAQTSIRSHAPARLRRQLDKVVTLQTQVDGVEKAIIDAKETIAVSGAPPDAVALLRSLEATHKRLNEQAEELYGSLNIGGSFPELADLPRPFVHTLLILNDLKTVIRRRAIASFQEWEALDRAVAGRREPLGTKLYQATRAAISKRQPALLKLIHRFNENCAKLEDLCPVGCRIPLPAPLPTQLTALRADPTLHEDVCISPSLGQIPRWLNDDDVRDGIRSLHIIDRCREEAFRLNLDHANLRLWLDEELSIVETALASHSDTSIGLPLQERQRLLQYLKYRWARQLQPQHLPGSLPFGFGPAEALPHHAQTPSVAPPRSPTFSIARIPSEHGADTQMSGMEVDSEEDSDLDDPGFVDVPTESRHDLRIRNASRTIIYERFSHFVVRGGLLYTLEIEPADLDRFLAPKGRLNGEGINGVMASLYLCFSNPYSPYVAAATRCAILSTYDLPRVRYKASDSDLWRFLGPTEYWTKSMWLLPIHRPAEQHWVCAVIDVSSYSIYFYDSLASQSGWRSNLREIMMLITRMVVLANRNGHPLHISTEEETWPAYPMFQDRAQQTNSYNCGLWVICMLAAVMHGFSGTEVYEADMASARSLLADHIRTLPIT